MSEQDKAMELISKFVNLGFTLDTAKQCALIVVDEIILTEPMIECGESDSGTEYKSNDEYWQEVKQHIENL